MSRQTATPRGMKLRADKLFSQIVRSRGACEACGKSDYTNLQCAHVISRRFANIRCDEANAYCLCAGCHHHYTDHPVEWGVWVTERMGPDEYDDLYKRAHSLQRVVWDDVVQRLKIRAQELELV